MRRFLSVLFWSVLAAAFIAPGERLLLSTAACVALLLSLPVVRQLRARRGMEAVAPPLAPPAS